MTPIFGGLEGVTTNLLFDLEKFSSAMNLPKFDRRLSFKDNMKRALKHLIVPGNTPGIMGGTSCSSLMVLSQIACTLTARSGNRIASSYAAMIRNVTAVYSVLRCADNVFAYQNSYKELIWFRVQKNDLVNTKYEKINLNATELLSNPIVAASAREKQFIFKFLSDGAPVKFELGGKELEAVPVSTNIDSFDMVGPDSIRIMGKPTDPTAKMFPYICVRVNDTFVVFVFNLDVPQAAPGFNGSWASADAAAYTANVMVPGAWAQATISTGPKAITCLTVNLGEEKFDGNLSLAIMTAITRKYIDTKNSVFSFNQDSSFVIRRRPVTKYRPLPENFDNMIESFRKMFDKRLHRGVCFVGCPGCGKSTLMRQISDRLPEYMTIQMRPEMLENDLAMSNMYNFVKVMRNAVILCDDLDGWIKKDKDKNISRWIDFFDRLNEMHATDGVSYLFCCTMNDPSVVNSTIVRRSGRIDEVPPAIGNLTMGQIDYLLTTYDAAINGEGKTDFSAPEFAAFKQALLDKHLPAADIYNIFSHVAIDGNFDGVYTPEMLFDTFRMLDERNELTSKSFLDEKTGIPGFPSMPAGFPVGFQQSTDQNPFGNLPLRIRHRNPITGELEDGPVPETTE